MFSLISASRITVWLGLYTLSEWCTAHSITVDCDTVHYVGSGTSCSLEDASDPKYAVWTNEEYFIERI